MYGHLTELRHTLIEGNEATFLWPSRDVAAWQLLPREWPGIRTIINQYVKRRDIVVQGGGCAGMYPRLLADMFSEVITFEPHPVNFHCLTANCQEDNIIKVQGALGATCNFGRLFEYDTRNAGMHYMSDSTRVRSIEELTGVTYPVMTLTVDSLQLRSLDLLMIDAEGYEKNIIDGALHSIVKHSPVIICEFPDEDTKARLASLDYDLIETIHGDSVFVRL